MQFNIKNVKISFDFWFFFTIAAFLLSDKSGLGGLIILSILLHEISHLLAMLLFKVDVGGVEFKAFGVAIKENGLFKLPALAEAFVYFAGPLCNFLLAFLGAKYFGRSYVGDMFVLINLVIAAFNLLPVACLDGGNILKALLGHYFVPAKVFAIMRTVSLCILVPLFVFALLWALFWGGNFTLVVTCFYLCVVAYKG